METKFKLCTRGNTPSVSGWYTVEIDGKLARAWWDCLWKLWSVSDDPKGKILHPTAWKDESILTRTTPRKAHPVRKTRTKRHNIKADEARALFFIRTAIDRAIEELWETN